MQGLILLPIAATAIALYGRRRLLAYWPLAVAVGAAALAYVLVKVAQGRAVFELGVYAGVRSAAYSAGTQTKWLVYGAGELTLALGVIPVCALVVLLARARKAGRVERAFLVGSTVVWSLVLGAVAASWEPLGPKERYVIHVAPVVFLALALWVDLGAPRPRRASFATALGATALVAVLPLRTLFAEPSLLGNAFGLIPFVRLADAIGSITATRIFVVLAAAGAAALFLLLPSRPAALLRFVLARPRFRVEGESIGRRGDLELIQTRGTVRLRSAIEAADASGETAGYAAYSVWTRRGPVTIDIHDATGPAVVVVGSLAPRPGGGARIGRETGRMRVAAPGGVMRLQVPAPPFRVEVHVLGERPRARIGFGLARA